jgi:predicted nucleic acid-binding protein
MTGERFLLDTVFIQALLNKRDPYYPQAIAFLPRIEAAREVWVTEAVLVEVGNALSAINRALAAESLSNATARPICEC